MGSIAIAQVFAFFLKWSAIVKYNNDYYLGTEILVMVPENIWELSW